MKKIWIVCMAICAIGTLVLPGNAFAKRQTIWDYLEENRTIRVFIADVTNATKDPNINTKDIRQELARALSARKSNEFSVVSTKEEADIAVSLNVEEYVFTEQDPIDMVSGAAAVAYDVVMVEHYARMQVRGEIVKVPSNTILWKEKFKATKTDPKMTQAESYDHMERGIVSAFLMEIYKRPKEPGRGVM